MGSPARRLTNPITRCRDQPHYRYAGTDDGRGTDPGLDTKRLTLMSGRLVEVQPAEARKAPRGLRRCRENRSAVGWTARPISTPLADGAGAGPGALVNRLR